MKRILNSLFFLILVLLPPACSRPDRSQEAIALSDELQNLAISDMETALERVDSAQSAGVFTDVKANTVKACIYENADLRQMAAYYAEKAIAEEEGSVTSSADSSDYCVARCILADNAYDNGAYGKSLVLAREVLDFTGNSTSSYALAMKCRALSQMADCESELNHLDQAERLFLQSIDISMEGTKQATSFSDIDPLFYSLLALSDLYLDNGMPERALPLHAKMDTAMTRLSQCPDAPDWVVQMRRNNVTISKAMVYAANGQRQQAETLFREHRQSPDLGASDKTAEGVYLTIMARLLGTNHQYVYAALRECADTTPADFLNLYRIRHAAKLLSTTDYPVGAIIEMSGIASRSTFNRLFRGHYSMSPSEFRKAAEQSDETVF